MTCGCTFHGGGEGRGEPTLAEGAGERMGLGLGVGYSCTSAILAYTIDMSVAMTASSSARDMK